MKVEPTPLPHPKLVAVSPEVCRLIGLSEDFCRTSEDFTRYFSGDISGMSDIAANSASGSGGARDGGGFQSWCTPYALSIFGNEFIDNCPFKTGNGYGDGRAISVGEVVVDGERWEMQLKGAGQTPFCRGMT